MTDHREKQQLWDRDEQFRRLVEEVEDYAIFMLDTKGYIRTWNEGARNIKGYDEDEIVGEHFSTFYPEDAREEGLPNRLLAEAREQRRTEHEGWRVRKDVSLFWASVTITSVHDDDGELLGFAKVTRDLTERVRHEQRLEQFAQAVSHDLRQPLRTMTSYLELLERRAGDELDPEVREILEDAIDGAKRSQAMVDGLLGYVRSEMGDTTLDAVDSESVVEDAIRDLDALVRDRNAEITVGSLPVVRADREQLHVVFLNLLENAIKYTTDGTPEVHVNAERSDGEWRFSVTDNGIGIPSTKTDEIFGLFERGHRERDSEGVGLGLALCKQIIEEHAGDIWVESTPCSGSTFYFTLPEP